jgi:hypothetical protein
MKYGNPHRKKLSMNIFTVVANPHGKHQPFIALAVPMFVKKIHEMAVSKISGVSIKKIIPLL